MDKKKIVFAGGGITALAAAYYLKKAGCEDFVILERHLEPGGLCRSVRKDGFIFDMTGHVLWRMDGETKAFYEDLLGENLEWTARKAAIATKGVRVPYPFQAHLKNLPPQVAYECLSGFLSRERFLKGVDFESWSRSMFGEGITEHFMRPFNEKLFGVPLREMTADWCQDVPVPSLDQIVRGAMLGETFEMKGNAKFAYPKFGGMQALVDALLDRVGRDKVMTGRNVCEVDVEARTISHRDMAGNVNKVRYERLVSTIPLTKLLLVTKPQDGKLREFAGRLRANNVACVMLGFERPVTDLHWLYTPDLDVPFYRLTFPTSVCADVAPPGNGAAMAEITIPEDLNCGVNDFVASALAGMRHLGLWQDHRDNPVRTMHVEYIAPAYVIFDLARRHVPKLVEGYNSMGVFPAGRFGKWDYTSVSDNVADGRSVAREILK